MKNYHLGIIGSGSWATALVKIFSEKDNLTLHWWVRNAFTARHIRQHGHNPKYLSSVQLDPSRLQISEEISKVIDTSDILIVAVPAAFLFQTLEEIPVGSLAGKKVVCAIKGMVPQGNLLPLQFFASQFGLSEDSLAAIAGPCHAEEVAMEKLSYLTVASASSSLTESLSSWLQNRYIKTTSTTNATGAEFAGILKNVYAIGSGIFHGLGYGDNFQAVYMSNAAREMAHFLNLASPGQTDVLQSAYLGDLLVTAYSQFSRNRTFGNMIGKGYSVRSAQMEMNMVAEGYYAVKSIFELNQLIGANIPVVEGVYRILYNNEEPEPVMAGIINEFS